MVKQTGIIKLKGNIGIAVATAGGAIITAPITLTALLVTVATYMTDTRTVITVVSQAVTIDEKTEIPKIDRRDSASIAE